MNSLIKEYIEKIFWIQNQVKLSHWQVKPSGWQHKVLGKYYDSISEQIDNLVETSIGIFGEEMSIISDSMFKLYNNFDLNNMIDEIVKVLSEFREAFLELEANSLVNIIDEMTALTYKTQYLLRRQ